MSRALLKNVIKKNILMTFIFLAIIMMYSVIMISMYSPESIDSLNAMFQVMPPDVMRALGFTSAFSTLAGYLASWLYGLIMTAFPMVYCIALGHRLIAKTVDSGSISCLLATPCSRTRLIATKLLYALGSTALMQMVIFALNLLFIHLMFPGESMDAMVFLKLNITVMLVNMTAMAITFFCSCLFSDPKLSLGFGAGIPIIFLLLNMLGNVSEESDILKDFSIYGWYDPVGIANGDGTLAINMIYIAIIAVLSAASIIVFRKKQLTV